MIKVGIIGCGKQADEHVSLLQRMQDCEIVGVCDTEELMAKQLYQRFKIKGFYNNPKKMIEIARPDVIHIITPPHSHLELGEICMKGGCHVLFEKPFTLNLAEAIKVIDIAKQTDRKLTVGHNNQFSHMAITMRQIIANGYLGGDPVHMESMWGYDLSDKKFAAALMGDSTHWIRKLPGKLLHNIISHGIARIAEYISKETQRVTVRGFTSNYLKNQGDGGIIDEVRVIIEDDLQRTAYFTFSTQIRPMIRQFRIFGPKRSLLLDDMHHSLVEVCSTDYKSYLNDFVPPAVYAKRYLSNSFGNMARFLKRNAHFDSGRKILVESFYESITKNTPVPIPYEEIILTSRIMDEIFAQLERPDNRGVFASTSVNCSVTAKISSEIKNPQ